MSKNLPEENLVRSYLLGDLSEKEQDDLEKRLLADPEFLERSRIIEDELLDDYVIGSLSEADRINVESTLLISAQQQRRVQLISLLRLKSKASTSAAYRSTELFSGLNRFFNFDRSDLAFNHPG